MSEPAVLGREAREPDQVLRYAPGETGVIDLYRPERAATAQVVLLHGGFWRARYDRRHLRPLASWLAEAGLSVFLPEYRRVGDSGGGWPGSLQDVTRILEALPALTAGEGELVLAGHSAGGHLALLAARGAPALVRRVVCLAGVVDLAAARRAGLSDGAAEEFLGPHKEELAAADPMQQPAPEAPTVLLHGLRDDEVPADYSVRYAARHRSAHLDLLDDADHYDLIDPFSAAASLVRDRLDLRVALDAGAP